MRKIIFVIYFFLTITLFGNDYYYHQLSGGTLAPASDNETYVELVDEVIVFELFDDYYTVTVDFNFYNHGEEIDLLVGFPYVADTEGYTPFTTRGSLYDFQSWVNGNIVETKNSPIEIDLSDQKLLGVNYVYTKEVTFPSRQNTKTKVKYNARYGMGGGYRLASYLYGSGKGWYDCIGKAEVIIKNSSRYWIYGIKKGTSLHDNMPLNNENLNHFWDNDNNLIFILQNFDPEYNDTIDIYIWFPMFDFGPKPLPYFFFYRTLIFKQNDLWYLTKEELRILRNLFYALHGYDFKDASLADYFSSNFGFYEVDPEFTEDMLTETEKRNIDIIRNEELNRN
jgi:hypothetical protein